MSRYSTARFTANNAKIEARLSTGEIIECYTALETDGMYSSWWEYPCEPQHGSVNYTEQEVNEENTSPLYNDEWEFVDEVKQQYLEENPEAFEDVKIVEIIKILDVPEWEVDEDSLE